MAMHLEKQLRKKAAGPIERLLLLPDRICITNEVVSPLNKRFAVIRVFLLLTAINVARAK